MECSDVKCPVHGNVKVRGNIFNGVVVSTKGAKTATIERKLIKYVQKYERYKKTRSKIYAHNPQCINAQEGDVVQIAETRRLSKTKNFVILKKLKEKGENEFKIL